MRIGAHGALTGRKRARSRGFTLIEILIALIVLSIGMLGIAALYLDTLRASRSALLRTDAVAMAADIADRIRANRPRNATEAAIGYTGTGFNDMAQVDLNDWAAAVARLPDGASSISYRAPTATTPSQYTIFISWTEPTQAQPDFFQLQVEL